MNEKQIFLRKNLLVFILFSMIEFFSSLVSAKSSYIVPEICVDRAKETVVFKNNTSKDFTDQALHSDFNGIRVTDLHALEATFRTTLAKVKDELDDDQSELFNYLRECTQNKRLCTGFFNSSKSFHVQMYCDKEIFTALNNQYFNDNYSYFQLALKLPDNEDKKQKLDLFSQNMSSARDTAYLIKMFNSYKDQSLTPDGYVFVFEKIDEEFSDLQNYKATQKRLDLYYNSIELKKQINGCCNSSGLLPEYQNSSDTLRDSNFDVVKPYDNLVFNPQLRELLLFDQATVDTWRNKIKDRNRKMSPSDQLLFIEFLQNHPLFYKDEKTNFESVKNMVRNTPPTLWKTNSIYSDQDIEKYKKEVNYFSIQKKNVSDILHSSLDGFKRPYPVPNIKGLKDVPPYGNEMLQVFQMSYENPDPYVLNLMFNPKFSRDYTDQLISRDANSDKSQYTKDIENHYASFFNGFLPYAYAQNAQAKILRELQKHKIDFISVKYPEVENFLYKRGYAREKKFAGSVIANRTFFISWAEYIICIPEHPEKSASPAYCASKNSDFRFQKYSNLYDDILTKRIQITMLTSESNQSYRSYLYGGFIPVMNQKIKDINDYCWSHLNRGGYKKNPKPFENDPQINKMLDGFYSLPPFETFLGQKEFADVFQVNVAESLKQCFTEGYIFGTLQQTEMASKMASVIGSASAGYVSDFQVLKTLPWKTKYLPSNFQVRWQEIKKMEDVIESRINDEFNDLRTAAAIKPFGSFGAQKDFLYESITKRIGSVVAYAQDYPSDLTGKTICNLIHDANHSDEAKIRFYKEAYDFSMIVMTPFLIAEAPELMAGRVLLYNWGKLLVIVAVPTGFSIAEISYTNKKREALSTAVATGNRKSNVETLYQQAMYKEELNEAQTKLAINLGLTLVVSTRPILSLVKFVQNCLNEFGVVYAYRAVEWEHFLRLSKLSPADFDQKFLDFIFNKNNISKNQFQAFMQNASIGQGQQFVNKYWSDKLVGLDIQSPTFVSLPQEPGLIQKIKSSIFENPVVQRLVIQPTSTVWTKLKLNLIDWMIRNWEVTSKLVYGDRLIQESKIAKLINQGVDQKLFTPDEVLSLTKTKFQFQYFHLTDDGRLTKYLDETILAHAEQFFESIVPMGAMDRAKIIEELHGQFKSEFLTSEEWEIFFRSYDPKRFVTSIDDCKDILKFLKNSEREYHDLKVFDPATARSIINPKDLFQRHVYPERTKAILQDVNRFLDLAKYFRMRNEKNLIEVVESFMSKSNSTLDEIETAIRQTRKDFSITEKFANKASINQIVSDFPIRNYGSKYEIEFIEQETKLGNSFVRDLEKQLKREAGNLNPQAFAKSYETAYLKVQIKKTLQNECQLPESKIRKDINNQFRTMAQRMALVSTATNYIVHHPAPSLDGSHEMWEWLSRWGSDVLIAYITSKYQAKALDATANRSWFTKAFAYEGADLGAVFSDAGIYQFESSNFWNTTDKFEAEFAKIVYSNEGVKESLDKYFQKYPKIKDALFREYDKIQIQLQDLEKKGDLGQIPAEELENEFVRRGLVESVFHPDMKERDQQLQDGYIYHDLMKEGLVSQDLFTETQDVDDDIMNLMTEIVYQDAKYKDGYNANRSSSSDFNIPFLDSEVDDRLEFNLDIEPVHFASSMLRNWLVYRPLCYGRYLPYPANMILAAGSYALVRIPYDVWKFDKRTQATGR